MEKGRKVFLSYHKANDSEVKKLIDELAKKGCVVKTRTTRSAGDQELEDSQFNQILSEDLQWAEIVFVLISEGSSSDESCLNEEIEEAHRYDKTIIGVFMSGATDQDVPETLNNVGRGLIPNDIERITMAIENKDVGWNDVAGKPRQKVKTIKKDEC